MSTQAATCPRCGTPHPAYKGGRPELSRADKIKGYGCLTVIVAFALAIYVAFQIDDAWNSAHPGMVKGVDGRPVPKKPSFDFGKPLFVKARNPICTSSEEVSAWHLGKPSRCIVVPFDLPVAYMETSGLFDMTVHVRPLLHPAEMVVEGWVSQRDLRN